MREKKLW